MNGCDVVSVVRVGVVWGVMGLECGWDMMDECDSGGGCDGGYVIVVGYDGCGGVCLGGADNGEAKEGAR